jgi:ADP-ribose pyrophosphatase
MWLYLAEDLQHSEATSDEDEFIELMPTSLDDAIGMVRSGKITDVKAVIGLFWAERVLKGQWKPSQTKKV